MNRIRKVFLGAVVALAITSCMGVAAASATFVNVFMGDDGTTASFNSRSYPVSLAGNQFTQTGAGNHKFQIYRSGVPYYSISCDASFESVSDLEESATYLPVFAEYENCGDSIGSWDDPTVEMNSCHYVYHSDAPGPYYGGEFNVVCELSDDAIEIKRYLNGRHFCTLSIPEADNISSVELSTLPSEYGFFSTDGLGIAIEDVDLAYERTLGSKLFCGDETAGLTYGGTAVLRGIQ
jgi:hypothetical protein